MKRVFLLLMLSVLLLCSCASARPFTRAEDGSGYTDTRAERFYLALAPAFEPASAGDIYGEYHDKERDVTRTFRVIPELDHTQFLTDENLIVYFAGETAPDPAAWQLQAALVCEEDAISVERLRLTAEEHGELLTLLQTTWFEGEGGEQLPLGAPAYTRRIKLTSAAYPNLFYCFTLHAYENGEGYFYDAVNRRTVRVPDALLTALYPNQTEES